MRSAALLVLVLLAAVPAAALVVADPPPVVTAYHIDPVDLSDELTPSPLNPAIVAAPGGAAVGFRATRLADPDPQVQAWVHDFVTGQTELAELSDSAFTQILGISADGDVLLLADSLGRPHLRTRDGGETVRIDPPAEPEALTMAAIALSADARTVWMQWAAPITDPDQRGSGWAVFSQESGLGEGTVTILDEALPIAGSPSLEWSVHGTGGPVELRGPTTAVPLAGLGDPAHLTDVALTDPSPAGSVAVAFISTDPTLPGGSTRCGGMSCAEVYRTTVQEGSASPIEWLSAGDGGALLADHATNLTISPSGDLVGFVAATPLVAGLSTDEVSNVFVAGTTHLRVVSTFNNGTADVEGGRWPAFLTSNDLLFYADLVSVSKLLGDPAPGLHVAQIQPFDDMAVNVHEGAIWWAVDAGITNGCTPERFCPSQAVTRAQAASLLARALDLAPVADGPFGDVNGVHATAINALAAAGLTNGCAPDSFCPDASTTRAQMATLLYRAFTE